MCTRGAQHARLGSYLVKPTPFFWAWAEGLATCLGLLLIFAILSSQIPRFHVSLDIISTVPTTMRLINVSSMTVEEFVGPNIPLYGILSHTWEGGELSYEEMRTGQEETRRGTTKLR